MELIFFEMERHTSIVVYGKEYYFGQGIAVDEPGCTVHGHPLEIIDMGRGVWMSGDDSPVHPGITHLTKDIFLEYIDNLRQVYTYV